MGLLSSCTSTVPSLATDTCAGSCTRGPAQRGRVTDEGARTRSARAPLVPSQHAHTHTHSRYLLADVPQLDDCTRRHLCGTKPHEPSIRTGAREGLRSRRECGPPRADPSAHAGKATHRRCAAVRHRACHPHHQQRERRCWAAFAHFCHFPTNQCHEHRSKKTSSPSHESSVVRHGACWRAGMQRAPACTRVHSAPPRAADRRTQRSATGRTSVSRRRGVVRTWRSHERDSARSQRVLGQRRGGQCDAAADAMAATGPGIKTALLCGALASLAALGLAPTQPGHTSPPVQQRPRTRRGGSAGRSSSRRRLRQSAKTCESDGAQGPRRGESRSGGPSALCELSAVPACLDVCCSVSRAACPQDVQGQEDPGQEGSPEQANPPVDPPEDRQQDQVSVDSTASLRKRGARCM